MDHALVERPGARGIGRLPLSADTRAVLNQENSPRHTLADLVASAKEGNPAIKRFECSVFDGNYVTGDIDEDYLDRLSLHRSDKMKQRRDADLHADQTVIELHNHA